MNYLRFLNEISAARKPSPIRDLPVEMLARASADLVFLSGGVPNPQMFPIVSTAMTLRDGSVINIEGKTMIDALQYSPTPGYGPLLQLLREMQETYHNLPPQSDVIVTTGSQDGLCKAFEMVLNTNDWIVIQEPIYAGTLSILKPYHLKYIAVKGDEHGLLPEELRNSFESKWQPKDALDSSSDIPKVIYVNPTGANPTGVTISLARRKEIYKICQEFDLLIFEDDPYFFLQYEQERIPSFLSLDVDGRVIRFDSMSKVISAGIRLGYVSGPRQLVQQIMLHNQVSVMHTPTFCQILTLQLLKQWGREGFHRHVAAIQEFYIKQRDAMIAAAETHLTGLCEWSIPRGGMFLWIKCLGLEDTTEMVYERAVAKDVCLLPGREFIADSSKPCPYVRASFSLAPAQDFNRAFRGLAEAIREEIAMLAQSPLE